VLTLLKCCTDASIVLTQPNFILKTAIVIFSRGKTRVVGKTGINTAIVSQTWKFWM